MNIEAYISSGVIEAYVSGVATPAEIREIEEMMRLHPEVETAVREQEDILFRYAEQHAAAPPAHLKQQIWRTLSAESLDESQPVFPVEKHITNRKPVRIHYALAASIVLLIASAGGNMWLMRQNTRMEHSIVALASRQDALQREMTAMELAEQSSREMIEVLTLPALKKISLAGVGTHTAHAAMLYWDGATGDVYLDMNSMPEAPAGKQYQLWAIIDGKPVDAGMYNAAQYNALHRMKTIARAEMFAVTIENSGGSPTPTLEQMVVAGKT